MLTVGLYGYKVCGNSVQYSCNFLKAWNYYKRKVFFYISVSISANLHERLLPTLVTEEAEFSDLSCLPDDQLEGPSSTMVAAGVHLCTGQCLNCSFLPKKTVSFLGSFLDNSCKHQNIHKFIPFDSKILYILLNQWAKEQWQDQCYF